MTAGRGAHEDLHLQYLAVLLLDERGDQIEIAIIDQDFRKVVGTERRTTLFDTEWSLRRPNQLAKTSGPTWAFKRALTRSNSASCRMSCFSPPPETDCFRPENLQVPSPNSSASCRLPISLFRCRHFWRPHLYARPPRPLESHAASAGRSDTHRTGLLISRHGTLRSFACLRLKQMSPRTSPYRFCTALFKPTGTVFPRCRLTAPSYVADSPSLLLPAPTHSQG